jgi:hypothetical protein
MDKEIKEKDGKVLIFHRVYKKEGLEKSAKILLDLIKDAQKKVPNKERTILIVIDGHRLRNKAFDNDMFSLQKIMLEHLIKYVKEIHMPLGVYRNREEQLNEIPEDIVIVKD